MATIHIRDVPEDTHRELKARATAQGVSLQRYVLDLLNERAARPPIAEVLLRAREDARRGGSDLTMDEIVEAVRAGRESRS
ncbi:MAG: type II toxin-antitoxin system HicB family antitoxin [Thermoleophilia bacterium]|nr:type II toxin-antitoxin system HicB family antitoxin [Thermoleophilia bacterium]MDH3724846.1 type II toxin-antitoxin system HicB family antitoxin [Thermoleophilia bacterium]